MEYKGILVDWLGHDSFRIMASGKTIYIDPFNISGGEKADLVLITHEHYDHCSPEDIEKIVSDKTSIVCNSITAKKLGGKKIIKIETGESVEIEGIKITAVPAYNLKKPFHPKGSGIGYLIETEGTTIYHAGDTDYIPEMNELKGRVNIALLPVSGTYVMTAEEAVQAAEAIEPEIVIPMHYASIVGTEENAKRFAELYKGKAVIPEKSS